MLKPTQKELDRIADSLEGYITILDQYMIIQGIDIDTYNESMVEIKTTIKNLRKGKTKKIFNKEKLEKYLYSIRNNKSYYDDEYLAELDGEDEY